MAQNLNSSFFFGRISNIRKESISERSDVFLFEVAVRNTKKGEIGRIDGVVTFKCRYYAKKDNIIFAGIPDSAYVNVQAKYDMDEGTGEYFFYVERIWGVRGCDAAWKERRDSWIDGNEEDAT